MALIENIPLQLPTGRVLSRLGYNRHLTDMDERQKEVINSAIDRAWALCSPRGVWERVPVRENNGRVVVLQTGQELQSAGLAELLSESHEVLLLASTVGESIMEAIAERFEENDGVSAAIFDAVGSESADACLDWMQGFVARSLPREGRRLTKMRFSPGYGDLGLENQKIIFDLLNLGRLGLTLTESFILVPEKSVIGIVGII